MLLLFLPATAWNDENDGSRDLVISNVVRDTADMEEMERKTETTQDRVEFGLTINGVYYPIPIVLEQLIRNGWTISDQTPYFTRCLDKVIMRRAQTCLCPKTAVEFVPAVL